MNEINLEFDDFINRVNPPRDLVKNYSLKENIYLIYVCLENKLGLFITGAPG